MVDTKLQDHIETLKKHGVESGEAASRRIVDEAEKKAAEILARANRESEGIVKEAKEEADRIMRQLHASMEIAASQFLTNLKRHMETNLLSLPLKGKVDETLKATGFLKELISACVKEFAKGTGSSDLTILVSKEQRDQLEDLVVSLIGRDGLQMLPRNSGAELVAWSIPDPYGEDEEVFVRTAELLERRIRSLLDRNLSTELSAP